MTASPPPMREVRASFDDRALMVYQAYSSAIADAAVAAGTFVPPFNRNRMTWIKPSFLWMMYRSWWGTKPGQERVLAITITHSGFEWALAHSCLSHYDATIHSSPQMWAAMKRDSPVRVQWDPERSVALDALPYRAIQVGLSGEAVDRYLQEWIVRIENVTALVRELHHDADTDPQAVQRQLPIERRYELPEDIRVRIGAS